MQFLFQMIYAKLYNNKITGDLIMMNWDQNSRQYQFGQSHVNQRPENISFQPEISQSYYHQTPYHYSNPYGYSPYYGYQRPYRPFYSYYESPFFQNRPHPHYNEEQANEVLRQPQPERIKSDNVVVKVQAVEEEIMTPAMVLAMARREKKILNLKPKHKKHRRQSVSYYWSLDENQRYSDFMKNNRRLFDLTISQKKNLRINVMMSKKVKTRTAQQCHSHHQKMVKKYGSIQKIIEVMEKTLEVPLIIAPQIPIKDQKIEVDQVKKQERQIIQ